MKAQEPTFDLTYDEFMKAAREVLDRSETVTTPFGTLTVRRTKQMADRYLGKGWEDSNDWFYDKSKPILKCTEKPPYGEKCTEPGCPIHDLDDNGA